MAVRDLSRSFGGAPAVRGLDLDLGLMRPDLSLTALATAGIAGPAALAPPEQVGASASLLFALPGDEAVRNAVRSQ